MDINAVYSNLDLMQACLEAAYDQAFDAIDRGDNARLQKLLDAGLRVDNAQGEELLHAAAVRSEAQALGILLTNNANQSALYHTTAYTNPALKSEFTTMTA